MTEAPIVRAKEEKNYKKQSPYIHRAYTYFTTKHNEIDTVVASSTLEMHSISSSLLMFVLLCENSTIYLLLLLLVRLTIKYIKNHCFPSIYTMRQCILRSGLYSS